MGGSSQLTVDIHHSHLCRLYHLSILPTTIMDIATFGPKKMHALIMHRWPGNHSKCPTNSGLGWPFNESTFNSYFLLWEEVGGGCGCVEDVSQVLPTLLNFDSLHTIFHSSIE